MEFASFVYLLVINMEFNLDFLKGIRDYYFDSLDS
jgi:hypothetical protein